jgi:hypothetical protein
MAATPSDLILIERGGVKYKINGADLIALIANQSLTQGRALANRLGAVMP